MAIHHVIWLLSSLLLPLFLNLRPTAAMVYLLTPENATFQYPDADAAFGPEIPTEGIHGWLQKARPIDACDPLTNLVTDGHNSFVIIERGGCVFDLKVWHAQKAGFSAAIVYNNEYGAELITMVAVSGRATADITIPSLFVTHSSGLQLLSVIGQPDVRCIITPSSDTPAWSLMALSFLSLLAVSSVLGTFFFLRRHRLRRVGSRLLIVPAQQDGEGIPASEVQALKSAVFDPANRQGDGGTYETCAICLEDYEVEEKLRILPCRHEFHMACIDQWLTTRRPFCPVCKGDVRRGPESTPGREQTPLLEGLLESPSAEEVEAPVSPVWFSSFLPRLLGIQAGVGASAGVGAQSVAAPVSAVAESVQREDMA